jgi:predicted nuclease with TOPRIM domain
MILDSLPEPVRDAVYATVGFPIVLAQEARTRQETLAAELGDRLQPLRERAGEMNRRLGTPPAFTELNTRVEERVKALEARAEAFETRLDELFDQWETQLPEPARDVVHRTRDAARDARTQLRTLVGNAA